MKSSIVLIVFVGFTAFAFGCYEAWSVTAAEGLLFVGAAWAGREREFWRFPFRMRLPAAALVVLLAVGTLQMVPLPAAWWRQAGAERVRVAEEGALAASLLKRPEYNAPPFGAAPPVQADPGPPRRFLPERWLPATFTPWATGRALLALAAGWCLILLIEDAMRTGRRSSKALVKCVAFTGIAVAAAGIAQAESPARTRVMWIRPSPYAASAFGPFVNANHGAAFVNLGFALVYYLAWRKAKRSPDAGNRAGIRLLILALASAHVAAVACAGSVGNLLVLGLYPLVFLLRPPIRRGGGGKVLGLLLLVVVASLLAAAFASGALTLHGRWDQYRNLNLDHWALGNGLGSFEWRWPATARVGTLFPSHYTHLENEYLEMFFEAGLPGLFASLAGLLWVLRLSWKGLVSEGPEYLLVPAAVGEASRMTVDFSCHIFPVVAAFLILCATLSRAGQRHPREQEGGGGHPIHPPGEGFR